MEPKNEKSKKLKKRLNDEYQHKEQIPNICNFISCNYCQGRPKDYTRPKSKSTNPNKNKFNPKAPEKICKYKNCKYCSRLLQYINESRDEYYINLAIEHGEKQRKQMDIEEKNQSQEQLKQNIINQESNPLENILNETNLKTDTPNQIIEKLKNIDAYLIPEIEIKGDGSCLYRAVLVSLGIDEKKFMDLRYKLSNLIMNSEIEEDIVRERNCENVIEFAEKIKNKNFYADHPEIYYLSKLLNVYIAIFDYNRNKWSIINHIEVKNPKNISFIIFKESSHEIGNHYDTFQIKNKFKVNIDAPLNDNENPITAEKINVMMWNPRSLNDTIKKIYLADIVSNTTPDIIILMETFLRDDSNLFIKNYKTYKTRNIERRKGIAILIHKNLLVSIIQINNDINGRFIKLSIKTEGATKSYTISGLYLEPNGDKNTIPNELFDSDFIIGDLNKLDTGLNKYGVYHYKNIKITNEYQINNKISDHNILFGEATMNIKRNELYSNINILDKKIIQSNNKMVNNIKMGKEIPKLINPHKVIKIHNYKFNPNDLNLYENWEEAKQLSKEQFENKYERINKIITSGNIDKETWTQLNKTFITNSSKELYTGDYMKGEIIKYYKELYESKSYPKIGRNQFLNKINDIITILLSEENIENENPIWPPKSQATDYNGFSQADIENIIKTDNLKNEIINFKILLAEICKLDDNSELFIHQISKSILFKKRDNIRGGTDIRVINILPGWLITLEKLSLSTIKRILSGKTGAQQFGFREGADCNAAKIMTWYNSSKLGFKKLLLIDIKKAFDSINRKKLKEMIQTDFKEKEQRLLIDFIDIYDNISLNILDEEINPTKGGPQGSSIVPLLFCYYINNAIKNCKLDIPFKLQLYADDIIAQGKTIEDLNIIYNKLKQELGKINLTINSDKCEIISDEVNDVIKDEDNDKIIMSTKKGKYLGQLINNCGLSENTIETKMFGKLISKLRIYNGFTKSTKIRIFKTYLVSKINHLLPLIALSNNLDISWRCIRKIIFRDILNRQTLPLETAISLGLGYYNIIIRPLIKLVERYKKLRNNKEEEISLMDATKKSIAYWMQIEKKQAKPVTEALQKILTDQIWLNEIELDKLLYSNQNLRLMRLNNQTLLIKDPKILKYPNINYNLSNAPYHEIIDTAISSEKINTNKEKYIKYKRIITLTTHLIIGSKIAQELESRNNNLIIPEFKNDNIIEEMILLEAQINGIINKLKESKEREAESVINELIKAIPGLIKNKNNEELKMIEFKKLRDIQNEYRLCVAKLSKDQARCIDIAHERLDNVLIQTKIKCKLKPGRPPKIKSNPSNYKDISDYFIKQN